MDIKRVSTYTEFSNLEPVWNSLLAKAATNTVFLTHEWASSWWNAYGGKRELSILVLNDGEAIRAIAPLMITDYGIFRRLGFIGSNRPDYCDFIVDRDHLAGYEALLTYLFYGSTDWDEIMFESIPETSPLLTALGKSSSRLIIEKKVLNVCPYMRINDKSGELLGRIEKSQSLRRKINRLQRIGNLTFRHYTELTEMEKALRNLLEGYLQRFDARNVKHRLPQELSFHMQLLHRMDRKDMIRFGALELDGRTIAQHFGFAYNGVYHWVRPAFDPSYSEHSPGVIMLYYLVDYALKNGFREFDFLRGNEPFKTTIADHARQVMIIKLYRNLPRCILCKAAASANRLLQRWFLRQT